MYIYCIPIDEKSDIQFPMHSKFLMKSSPQLQTFNKTNVELITEKIEEITPAGIRSCDGVDREVDVIIYATGE